MHRRGQVRQFGQSPMSSFQAAIDLRRFVPDRGGVARGQRQRDGRFRKLDLPAAGRRGHGCSSVGQFADNGHTLRGDRRCIVVRHGVKLHVDTRLVQVLDLLQTDVAPQFELLDLVVQRGQSVAVFDVLTFEVEHFPCGLHSGQFRPLPLGLDSVQHLEGALQGPDLLGRLFVHQGLRGIGGHQVDGAQVANGLQQTLAVLAAGGDIDLDHRHDHESASHGSTPTASSGNSSTTFASLPLAILARPTAAVISSPSLMRIRRMASRSRGIMTFSNRLTR